MRLSRNRTARALFCIAGFAAVTSSCAAIGQRRSAPDEEGPELPPTPHTATSSDSHVDRDEGTQSYSRIEELIEGRAPGVRVIRHQDGSFRLQIRGISSPAGRNDPLIVVDGTPTAELRSGSALASLNPADVVRIEVLKDAASTAFYGMRGANGVIVITTRQH
jgi:TonB-dependent SusC/RagA subfamily outer membrane receptor